VGVVCGAGNGNGGVWWIMWCGGGGNNWLWLWWLACTPQPHHRATLRNVLLYFLASLSFSCSTRTETFGAHDLTLTTLTGPAQQLAQQHAQQHATTAAVL
jgi:hypothetical protein